MGADFPCWFEFSTGYSYHHLLRQHVYYSVGRESSFSRAHQTHRSSPSFCSIFYGAQGDQDRVYINRVEHSRCAYKELADKQACFPHGGIGPGRVFFLPALSCRWRRRVLDG